MPEIDAFLVEPASQPTRSVRIRHHVAAPGTAVTLRDRHLVAASGRAATVRVDPTPSALRPP